MNRNDFRRFWGFNTRILRVVEWIQDQRWNPSDLGSFDRIILGMLGQSGIIKSGTICGTMFGRCMMLFPPKHPKTIALYVCIYIYCETSILATKRKSHWWTTSIVAVQPALYGKAGAESMGPNGGHELKTGFLIFELKQELLNMGSKDTHAGTCASANASRQPHMAMILCARVCMCVRVLCNDHITR